MRLTGPQVAQRVAVILTSFNRRELTLSCLASLREQADKDVDLDVFLVDDGSTDGTASAVQEHFPDVHLLHGDGSLYWTDGMRLAFAAAMDTDPDAYLWMNDDTTLDPGAVRLLMDTWERLRASGFEDVIVTGTTRHPDTGELTYGGQVRPSRWRPLRFRLVAPASEPRQVDTMNGNCVLFPRAVVAKVGNIDGAYVQKMGDFDYGLRARASGCSVWVAPGVVGECASHPARRTHEQPLLDELRRLWSIKELPPSAWATFTRRSAGPLWPLYWASPYVRGATRLVSERLRRRTHTLAPTVESEQ